MTRSLLSMPIHQWPEGDHKRWRLAQNPADFLAAPTPASGWSIARRRIVI